MSIVKAVEKDYLIPKDPPFEEKALEIQATMSFIGTPRLPTATTFQADTVNLKFNGELSNIDPQQIQHGDTKLRVQASNTLTIRKKPIDKPELVAFNGKDFGKRNN